MPQMGCHRVTLISFLNKVSITYMCMATDLVATDALATEMRFQDENKPNLVTS